MTARQGQGQYDKSKKTAQKGGGRSAGVAVKEEKASRKGGSTGGKNPNSYNKNPNSYNKNPNPKSYENSNPRSYSGGRSGIRLPSQEDENVDEDEDDDGDDSRRNPRSNNISNNSRNSRSDNTSSSSRGSGSIRTLSEDDEESDGDESQRKPRLYNSKSNGSRNSRSSNTTSSSVKGGSRLRTFSDEDEDDEDEDEDDFDEEDEAEGGYAELPITPIPPAGFVLAEDGSVSIMAPPQKRVTTLVDLETKLPLDCLIRRVFSSSDGRQCFLLCPLDTPVQILRIDDRDVLKEISDEELEDVFPTASYELAKRRLHLIQSGYCLTLRGGFCFSDDEVIDLDTVYGEGDRSLNEGVEVASFIWNDSEYLIFTPFDPLMFVSYKDNKTGELLIADDDLLEDEAVLDAIDEEKEFQAYMEEDNLMVEDDEEEE